MDLQRNKFWLKKKKEENVVSERYFITDFQWTSNRQLLQKILQIHYNFAMEIVNEFVQLPSCNIFVTALR